MNQDLNLSEINIELFGELESRILELDNLLLNPNNPRIMGKSRMEPIKDIRALEEKVQESVLKEMKQEGLSDIIEKVKKIGFLPIDRVVVRRIEDTDKYLVLEGNRRISSLRIIREEHERGILTLSEKLYQSILKIEVLEYTGSDENIEWLLQGIRHINGIREWGPLQQSKFLVEMQDKKHLKPTDLDKMTGLGRNTISNKIRSYKGWLHAVEIYDGDVQEEHFSLFSEAIFARPKIKDWLKWEDDSGKFENEDNFYQLLEWFIGDQNDRRRFTRALDVRDVMSKLLLQENNDLLDKFLNEDDYSVEEVKYDLNKKNAEKDERRKQLDAHKRLEEIESINGKLGTLPIKIITDNKKLLNDYIAKISELISTAQFQIKILNGYTNEEG